MLMQENLPVVHPENVVGRMDLYRNIRDSSHVLTKPLGISWKQ